MCATLAGASSLAAITDWSHDLDDAGRVRLGFAQGVPAGTTVWRLLIRLDADLLTTLLAGWLRTRIPRSSPSRLRRARPIVIAVDGKTLRGARRGDGTRVHLLSALDTSTGIVLAQVTVEAKSNEIPAFTPLLDAVETVLGSLAGALFVADALHTQTGHANEIAKRGGHLMIPVKGNQCATRRSDTSPPGGGTDSKGGLLGLMAYLDLKGEGDKSMPGNRWLGPGAWDGVSGDPCGMAKA